MPAFRPQRKRDAESAPPELNIRVAALRLLGRRDYTAAELTDRLSKRGYTDEAVGELVGRLRDERVLDDRRVADAHVRAASRIKRRGGLRIERELVARGIARATAHKALTALSADDELAAIRQVLARRRVPATPDQATRRKVFQHLLRRGFSGDAIAKALGGRGSDDD